MNYFQFAADTAAKYYKNKSIILESREGFIEKDKIHIHCWKKNNDKTVCVAAGCDE